MRHSSNAQGDSNGTPSDRNAGAASGPQEQTAQEGACVLLDAQDVVKAWLTRRGVQPDLAEEFVDDALVDLLGRDQKIWTRQALWAAAHHRYVDYIRRSARSRRHTHIALRYLRWTEQAPVAEDSRTLAAALHDAISALPAPERRLVDLCILEGRPAAEVAASDGVTRQAIQKRLARARQRLRTRLGNYTAGSSTPGITVRMA